MNKGRPPSSHRVSVWETQRWDRDLHAGDENPVAASFRGQI